MHKYSSPRAALVLMFDIQMLGEPGLSGQLTSFTMSSMDRLYNEIPQLNEYVPRANSTSIQQTQSIGPISTVFICRQDLRALSFHKKQFLFGPDTLYC